MLPRKARAVSVLTLSALAITGAALVVFGSLEPTGSPVQGKPLTTIQSLPIPAPVERVEVAPAPASASAPLSISFASAGIAEHPITPYTDEEVAARNGVNPYTMDQISWWSGGGMPSSDGTAYLYGHTWIEPAVFNGFTHVKIGDQFSITTATQTVTYEVVDTFSIPKPAFSTDPRVSENAAGRIVLATCDRNAEICPSCRTVDNIVVIGQQL